MMLKDHNKSLMLLCTSVDKLDRCIQLLCSSQAKDGFQQCLQQSLLLLWPQLRQNFILEYSLDRKTTNEQKAKHNNSTP